VVRISIKSLLRVLAASTSVAFGCGTQERLEVASNAPTDAGLFSLSGYVLKGPGSGATVAAFKLHPDLTAGDPLATATTDDDGFFGLTLPPYNGDVLLVATGGTYAEEALPLDDQGNPRRLALDRDFLGVALDVQTGQPATANITPISHWAVQLARSTPRMGRTATRPWSRHSRT
jgi:hypothetical protein